MTDIMVHISEPQIIPENVKFVSIQELETVSTESFEHILLQDLLDYFPNTQIDSIVQLIYDKLQKRGKLSLQSIDLKQMSIAIAFDSLNIDAVSDVLYPNKQSIHTLYQIEKILIRNNFRIMIKKYSNDIEYFILAEKI